MRGVIQGRAAAWSAAAALGLASLLLAAPARAGSCGPDCHTVCESGCDFASPRACANGAEQGETCLVSGGRYRETVGLDAGVFTTDLRFVCADPEVFPCRIDGDAIRDHGFLTYWRWEIEGFEILNTKSHAISHQPGREPKVVRGCYIHDVGGRGIANVDDGGVVEGNHITRAFLDGIVCTNDDALVIGNLVTDVALESGSGIACTASGAQVVHNTVDVRRSALAVSAVSATDARYNIAAGGHTALAATVESLDNLAFAWRSAAFSGVAGPDDHAGDPRFFHVDDHHLMVGSAAIDLAVASTLTDDLDGDPRDALPDAGAYEHDPADVAGPRRWPVDEIVKVLDELAAPTLVHVPGQGPAIVYVDQAAGAIVHAARRADGTWDHEVVKAGVALPSPLTLDAFRHPVAAAVDPTNGQLAIAWTERGVGDALTIRFARLDGDLCSVSDCTSPRWSQCQAPPVFEGVGAASLDLTFDPRTGVPVIAFVYQQAGLCAGAALLPRIVERHQDGDGTWHGATIESGDCTASVGRGVAVSVEPQTGVTDIVYTRAPGAQTGALVHATNASGAWVVADVPLGAGYATHRGGFTRVDARHLVDGRLGVVYTQQSPFGSDGFGYSQRVDGVWVTPTEVVDVMGPSGIRPMEGLSLAFDGNDLPHVAYTRNGVLRSALWRPDAGWEVAFVDPERPTGLWATLALGPTGRRWIAYQSDAADDERTIRFVAEHDPGGVAPGPPLGACDDGDICTDSHCDPMLGCVHPEQTCDDDDACTNDRCHPEMGCVNEAIGCDDLETCTDDTCDPAIGCVFTPHEGACDDGDPTTIDRCREGACVGVPAVVVLPVIVEGVAVSDLPVVAGPVILTIVEGVAVSDLPAVHGPVVIQVAEGVAVSDLPAVHGPVVLTVVEGVAVSDLPAVHGPVVLQVVEGVAVSDLPAVHGPVVLQVVEGVAVSDLPAVHGPVVIQVVEGVAVSDLPAVHGPVVIQVAEGVAVSDLPDVIGPVVLAVVEGVAVSDLPAVHGPVVLQVVEGVAVDDGLPLVVLPVSLVVLEGVAIADAPTVTPPIVLPLVREGVIVDDDPEVEPEPLPERPPRPRDCAGAGADAAWWVVGLLLLAARRRRRRSTPTCAAARGHAVSGRWTRPTARCRSASPARSTDCATR